MKNVDLKLGRMPFIIAARMNDSLGVREPFVHNYSLYLSLLFQRRSEGSPKSQHTVSMLPKESGISVNQLRLVSGFEWTNQIALFSPRTSLGDPSMELTFSGNFTQRHLMTKDIYGIREKKGKWQGSIFIIGAFQKMREEHENSSLRKRGTNIQSLTRHPNVEL